MQVRKMCAVIGLFICLCFCGCSSREIFELSCSPEMIVKIELYYNLSERGTCTAQENITLIKQLDEDEINMFTEEVSALELEWVYPPVYGYGNYIAAITYSNGDVDVLSNYAIEYIPFGSQPGEISGDIFSGDTFDTIFLKYADLQSS